ncbi:MAG: GAF domain-containing protein [Nitrospinota bacterium]|nr:MAG: GAF domain-containing protein [Nitrospinota bacterium]
MNQPLRILLIDDNPDDRLLVRRELEKVFPRLQVEPILDEQGLTRALAAGGFALVITDYHLHWTNGLAILQAIKTRYPDCPVIMLTGSGTEEIAVEAMKAGLDDYVIKSPRHYSRLPVAVQGVLERVRQRQAVQEAEAQYRRLFEDVPIGLWRTTPEGRFLDVNTAYIQMLGYPDRETLMASCTDTLWVHPQDRQYWKDRLEREGVVCNFEGELRCWDGRVIWTRSNSRCVRDKEGRVLYYEGSEEDITAQKQREEALQRYAKRLEMLREIDQAILTARSLDSVAWDVLQRIQVLIPYQRGSVVLFDFAAQEAILLATHTRRETRWGTGARIPLDMLWIMKERLQKVFVIEDIRALSHPSPIMQALQKEGLRSVLSVPLVVQEQLIGALNLWSDQPDAFSSEQVEIAADVASSLAIALQQARLYTAMQQEQDRLKLLVDIATGTISTLDLESLLDHLLRRLVDITPAADIGVIFLYDSQTRMLIPQACVGFDEEAFKQMRLRPGETISGTVLQTGRPLLTKSREETARFQAALRPANARLFRQATRGIPIQSVICLPLQTLDQQTIGTLALGSSHSSFHEEELFLLEGLAAQAAVAIHNVQLYRQIRQHAAELEQREYMLLHRQEALQAVYQMATTINASSSDICAQVAEHLVRLLQVPRVEIECQERGGLQTVSRSLLTEENTWPEEAPLSTADIPIKTGTGQRIGRIRITYPAAQPLTEEGYQLIEIFVRYIAYEMERQALEEQLQRAREMEVIGRLAAGVAHEVRNPLNAILAVSEALFQDLADRPEYQPYLTHIRTQVDRLAVLMRDLLELGRPVQTTHLHRESLPALCASALELWQQSPLAQTHPVHLVQPAEGGSLELRADRARLQQVVMNLLDNAAQHSPPEREITLAILPPAGGMLRVQVIDQGTGIAAEHLPHIFEPFFTTRRKGIGLGLSLVKHIVEAHGGTIRVWNNTPPPGCTVEIRLPQLEETHETAYSPGG